MFKSKNKNDKIKIIINEDTSPKQYKKIKNMAKEKKTKKIQRVKQMIMILSFWNPKTLFELMIPFFYSINGALKSRNVFS